jgi:hypothetical protein
MELGEACPATFPAHYESRLSLEPVDIIKVTTGGLMRQ